MGNIDGDTSSDAATDEAVNKWFDEKLDAASKDEPARIISAIDEVTFVTSTTEPEGGMQHFIININAALDRKNVFDVVNKGEERKI